MNKCLSDSELAKSVTGNVLNALKDIHKDKGLSVEEKQNTFDDIINSLIVDNIVRSYGDENGVIEINNDTQSEFMRAINTVKSQITKMGSYLFKGLNLNIDVDSIMNGITGSPQIQENPVIDDDSVHIIDLFDRNNNSITSFREKVYGSQEAPYKRMEAIFNDAMYNAMIINGTGDNATPVLPEDIQYNIANVKIKYMSDIANFILKYSDNCDKDSLREAIDLYNNAISLFENKSSKGDFVAAVNKIDYKSKGIRFILDSFRYNFENDKRFSSSKLSEYAVSNDVDDVNFLDAYNKVFILKNLSSLINYNFENVFDITSLNHNDIIEQIAFKKSLSNIHNTWLDNDDVISAYKEAGSITKLIMSSMRYYNGGVKTNRKLGFNEINDAIGVLKSISYNTAGNVDVVVKRKNEKYGFYETKTYNLRQVISGINRNSPEKIRLLYDILINGVVGGGTNTIQYIANISSILPNKNVSQARRTAIINNITSLFRNINDLGLFNIRKACNDPRYINYYNFIANYIQGAYRNSFMQRTFDFDSKNITTVSMLDRQYMMAKSNFESKVYSSNYAIINNINRYARQIEKDYAESYPKDSKGNQLKFKILNNIITVDESSGKREVINDPNGSYVEFRNFPFIKDGKVVLTNIRYNFGETSFKNAVQIKTIDGIGITESNISSILEASTDGSKTSADKFIQDVFQINTVNDSELRKYLYTESSVYNMIKAASITASASWLNSNVYSNEELFETQDDIRRDIISRSGDSSYLTLFKRRGINNMPSIINSVSMSILNAIVMNNNMISRDTVKNNEGKQLAITNMQRLMNSMDEQIDSIRENAENASMSNPLAMNLDEINGVVKESIGSQFMTEHYNKKEMIYLGNTIEREISLYGRTKERSDFNVAECLFADFVSSYLDDIYGTGNYSFVTSINSDKSLVNRTEINRHFIEILRNAGVDLRAKLINDINKKEYDALIKNIGNDYYSIKSLVTIGSSIVSPELLTVNGERLFNDNEINELFTNEELETLSRLNGYDASNVFDQQGEFIMNNFYEFNRMCDTCGIKNGYDLMLLLSKYSNIIYDKILEKGLKGLYPNARRNRIIDQTHLVKYKDFNDNTRISMNKGIMVEYFTCHDEIDENTLNRFGFSRLNRADKIRIYSTKDTLAMNAINAAIEAIAGNGFEARLYDDSGRQIKMNGLINLMSSTNPKYSPEKWFSPTHMIMMKIIDMKGNVRNISNINDMVDAGIANSSGSVNWGMLDYYKIIVNPIFEEYNTIQSFISEQALNIEVGGRFNHPIKGEPISASQLRSALQVAQTKRNVSITASYHPLTLQTLDGLQEEIEVACITDIAENKSSFIGNNKSINPHDGATFISPLSFYWWNNSMADTSAKGFNLKPFIHYYDNSTMTAGIIKTAGFPITNNMVRAGVNYDVMAYKFLSAKWKGPDGRIISGDIFSDFGFRMFESDGTPMNIMKYIMSKYKDSMYFKESKDVISRIDKIEYDGQTGTYTLYKTRVDKYGNKVDSLMYNKVVKGIRISSNYDLWKAFGGEQNMSLNENGTLEYSEDSFKIVSDIANNIGLKNDGTAIDKQYSDSIKSQDDVYQFMKYGNPHMVVTNGAIKQGLTNVNKHEDFYNNRRGKLNTYKIKITAGGIQLDKSHESEGHEISELTQVMSSLSSMGYTKDKAQMVYNAISGIIESSLSSIISNHLDENGTPKYNDVSAELIIRAIADSSAFDDDIKEACKPLINKYKNDYKITYDELENLIHVNDNVFINKAIPIIMSLINKISIKKSYAGGLNVINPSYGLVKLYNGMLWNGLGVNNEERIDHLLRIQRRYDNTLVNPRLVKPQHIYKAFDSTTGTTTRFVINTYEDYLAINNLYNDVASRGGMLSIHELIIDKVDNKDDSDIILNSGQYEGMYKLYGRELAQEYYEFSDGENSHTLFELDSTRWMFDVKNNKITKEKLLDRNTFIELYNAALYMKEVNAPNSNGYESNLMSLIYEIDKATNTYKLISNERLLKDNLIKFIRGWHQSTVKNLSKAMNNAGDGKVAINGQYVVVKSGQVSHFASEAIAPCLFREEFGIPKDTPLKDITPEFFARQAIDALRIKIDPDMYHYALLHNSIKNSVYVYDSNIFGSKSTKEKFKNYEKLDESRYKVEDGSDYKWVLSKKGEYLFMVDKKDVVYDVNGCLVVVTNDATKLLKKQSYSGIDVSRSVYSSINGDWRSKDSISRIRSINDIIVKTFESAKFIYDKNSKTDNGGSRSASYWTRRQSGQMYAPIMAVLEMAQNKAMAFKSNDRTDGFDNIVQKTFFDKLNKYGIESFASNNSSNYEKIIYRNAISKYNSFKKSLDILAARTPSQTMQSFMSMKISEFDNSGLNQCFVSTSQIWFQGSDFDIDAVNFQSYKVDRRGHIIGWSPLFDDYNIEKSMNIPFPTGKKLKVRDVNMDKMDSLNSLFNRIFSFNSDDGTYTVKGNTDLDDISEFIKACNAYGFIPVPKTDNEISEFSYDNIDNLINGHNLYFTEYDGSNHGFKNFITKESINISSDIVNIIESESSVDDQPDVKRAGEKNIESARRMMNLTGNTTNTYSLFNDAQVGKDVVSITAAGLKNFFLVTHAFNMSNVNAYYNELKNANNEEQEKVAISNIISTLALNNGRGVNIGKKIYYVSSNFNPSDSVKSIIHDIYFNYSKQLYDLKLSSAAKAIYSASIYGVLKKNNALIMSALLSEATDNMKNLNLAKINATKDMAPLYIFGLTIGMDIDEISEFMQSKTARIIDRIKHGNVFFGDDMSKLSISDIYAGISRFGKFYKYTNAFSSDFTDLLKNSSASSIMAIINRMKRSKNEELVKLANDIDARISEMDVKYGLGEQNSLKLFTIMDLVKYNMSLYDKKIAEDMADRGQEFDDYDDAIFLAKVFRYLPKISSGFESNYGLYNNLIDNLINAVNSRKVIENDNDNIKALIKLDEGNKEMLRLALFASLNKGVKTTQQKIIEFNTRLSNIMTYDPEVAEDVSPNGEESIKTKIEKMGAFLTLGKTNMFMNKNNSKSKFDLDMFVRNKSYRDMAIQYYGAKYQVAFNVLGIAATMPHISSYARTANRANSIVDGMSPKKKIINEFVDAIIEHIGYTPKKKDKEALIRSSSKFINNIIFNSWLREKQIKFYVPDGCKYYVNVSGEPHNLVERINNTGKPKEMYLGTDSSNATFIEYMNSYVIPNLKDGYTSDSLDESMPKVNEFIDSLNTFTSNKVYTGNNIQVFAPPVSTRSNDEVDMIKVTSYKTSSKYLGNIKYTNKGDGDDAVYSAANLFYLYNQILYSGALNDSSLDEYTDESTMKNEYLKYESDVSENRASFIDKVAPGLEITDQILMETAPVGDGYNTSLPYHRFFDNSTMKFMLLRKKTASAQMSRMYANEDENDDSEYINDIYNDMDDSYEEEYTSRSMYNTSKYEYVDSNVSANSFVAEYDYDSVPSIDEKTGIIRMDINSIGASVSIDKNSKDVVNITYTDSEGNSKTAKFSTRTVLGKSIVSLSKCENYKKIKLLVKEFVNMKNNCN